MEQARAGHIGPVAVHPDVQAGGVLIVLCGHARGAGVHRGAEHHPGRRIGARSVRPVQRDVRIHGVEGAGIRPLPPVLRQDPPGRGVLSEMRAREEATGSHHNGVLGTGDSLLGVVIICLRFEFSDDLFASGFDYGDIVLYGFPNTFESDMLVSVDDYISNSTHPSPIHIRIIGS